MLIKDIQNIIAIFNQPYPFYYYAKRLFSISLVISVFVTLFLFIIRPFDTNISELRYNYFITCSIYGIVSGLSFYLIIRSLVIFFPAYFKEEKWTLAKELLTLIILLFIIGNINFFIRSLVNTKPDNFKRIYYLEEIAHTCLIGIFPIGFFTLLNYSYLFKSNNDTAIIANSRIIQKQDMVNANDPDIVNIVSQSIYETITLPIDTLGFIKSDGNYIEIYQSLNGTVKKHMIRNTLKDIEKQLADYAYIVKTHRSYLVNIHQIESVKGNAQGYTLKIKDYNFYVPVSRNNISQFNTLINSFTT
ncbi:MAG: LytTR family transcriptional regulator DNA-binding domain-containing protein [Bacteroidales bacterium]|nr:LytTR family transcriptional regulator DNA-binding domain-containing protein [Bacteroidales bacterium]